MPLDSTLVGGWLASAAFCSALSLPETWNAVPARFLRTGSWQMLHHACPSDVPAFVSLYAATRVSVCTTPNRDRLRRSLYIYIYTHTYTNPSLALQVLHCCPMGWPEISALRHSWPNPSYPGGQRLYSTDCETLTSQSNRSATTALLPIWNECRLLELQRGICSTTF